MLIEIRWYQLVWSSPLTICDTDFAAVTLKVSILTLTANHKGPKVGTTEARLNSWQEKSPKHRMFSRIKHGEEKINLGENACIFFLQCSHDKTKLKKNLSFVKGKLFNFSQKGKLKECTARNERSRKVHEKKRHHKDERMRKENAAESQEYLTMKFKVTIMNKR